MTPSLMKSVLSIQSHVAHGYVGNRAAIFPLQAKGWDVDEIHTVNYSNHTGYGLENVFGRKSTPEDLANVYKGLRNLKFEYQAVLTGYTPNAATLQQVRDIALDVKDRYPSALWVLDPVMGDGGQLYVEAGVVPIYKQILETGKVDLITPNQFEAELLSGVEIVDVASVKKAIAVLHHEYKVPHVIITSCVFEDVSPSKLFCFVSQVGRPDEVYCLQTDMLNGYFTGTGDLFAAMILDGLYRHSKSSDPEIKFPLLSAARDTMAILHGVLERTLAFARSKGHTHALGIKGDQSSMRDMELRVIDSLDIFCSNDPASKTLSSFECNRC